MYLNNHGSAAITFTAVLTSFSSSGTNKYLWDPLVLSRISRIKCYWNRYLSGIRFKSFELWSMCAPLGFLVGLLLMVWSGAMTCIRRVCQFNKCNYLYILMHLLLEIIGSRTSLKTGDICPYSDSRPHPVTVPVWPTRLLSELGRQIGMIFGWYLMGASCISNKAMSYS